MVSVQPFQCPLFEEFGGLNSRPNVTWQTMLKSSAFMINKKEYKAGFFLVLKVIEEEGTCKNVKHIGTNQAPTLAKRLRKSFRYIKKCKLNFESIISCLNSIFCFSFIVTNNISRRQIHNEVLVTAALFLGMAFLVCVITLAFRVYRGRVT